MKTGYKTTEFWLTLLAMVGALLVGGGYATQEEADALVELLLVILPPIAYTVSRAWLKVNQ